MRYMSKSRIHMHTAGLIQMVLVLELWTWMLFVDVKLRMMHSQYAYLQMIESILCFLFVCIFTNDWIHFMFPVCIVFANDWIQFIRLTKWFPICSINWWCLKQAFWKIVHSQDAYLQMIESIQYALTTYFLVPIWIFSTITSVLF